MKITLTSARTRWLIIVTITCTMFFSQAGYSQLIGSWNFNNTINGVPGSNNTVSVADFSTGLSSTSFNGGMEYFGQNNWPTGALDPALYMEFTLTPNSGYSLNISNLYLRVRHSNTGSNGGSGPKTFSVRSSLDGYTADIYNGNITSNYSYHTVNPGSSFQNLPTAVTFRVYGYNSVVNSGGTSRFVFDNIDVNGIGVVLPVKLRSFYATKQDGSVKLDYLADNSARGAQYTIERAEGTNVFTPVHVLTQQNNDVQVSNQVLDADLPSNTESLHYRLIIRSVDGSVTVSTVSTIRMQPKQTQLRACTKSNAVYITGMSETDSEIMLINSAGQIIVRQSIERNTGSKTIEYPSSVTGTIHVIVTGKTERRSISVIAL